MDSLSFKTLFINNSFINKHSECYLIDATGYILGRLTSNIIKIITGKHKSYYTPHVVCGDEIIIINASKVKLTGNKLLNKKYIRYTGYPGGKKHVLCKDLLLLDASKVLISSIKGMLPKNKLYDNILNRIHIFNSNSHKINYKHIKTLEF